MAAPVAVILAEDCICQPETSALRGIGAEFAVEGRARTEFEGSKAEASATTKTANAEPEGAGREDRRGVMEVPCVWMLGRSARGVNEGGPRSRNR